MKAVWIVYFLQALVNNVAGFTLANIRISLEDVPNDQETNLGDVIAAAEDTSSLDVNQLVSLVQTQQSLIQNLIANVSEKIGVNYVRWGRTECPSTATKLFDGYTASSRYSHSGGGVDYLCMSKDPEYITNVVSGHQSHSYLYGVEYQTHTNNGASSDVHDHDAPCAVCVVNGRSQKLTMYGRLSCEDGWTKEYSGLIMSTEYTQAKANRFACVDMHPDTSPGGHTNDNGGLFYAVEAVCGSLPCPPYISGNELSCTVCTK